MKPAHKRLFLIGAPIVAIIAITLAVMGSGRGTAQQPSSEAAGEVAAPVSILRQQPAAITEEVPGTVAAIQHAELSPKVMGRVAVVYVREGDHVKAGQLLARLEGKDLAANVQQAQAALEQAQAQLAKAKQGPRPEQIAQADEAERRAKAAFEQAAANLALVKEGARTQQKLQADQGVLAAQQQVTQAQAGLATAKAGLANAQVDYDRMSALYKQDIIPKQRLDGMATQLEAMRQAVEQATAGVSQAKAGLEIAKAQASLVYEGARTQEIVAAEKQVEQAKAAYEQARQEAAMAHQGGRWEDVSQASAGVSQAKAGLTGAQTMAGYTAIYAPFSGVITGRKADPGNMAMPQMPILALDDDSLYQLVSQVPERLAAKLTRGARVMVRIDALQTTLPATIAEIVPSADPASRTLTVKANLPHAADVKSGLFGRLTITTGNEMRLMLPAGAIVERNGLTGVYVVDESETAQYTLVTLGKQQQDRVQVLSGLREGQRVVTARVDQIKPGQRIRAEGVAL